ncbi:unnamed protein product [Oikopleura dioica]|uniref:Uncharacterized protein n=1 Tax=Oikopleura dioica TaxID=34765 RepID=E4YBJ5_OIKDI|nr:unnamed protein product [Oikopleura dioica]
MSRSLIGGLILNDYIFRNITELRELDAKKTIRDLNLLACTCSARKATASAAYHRPSSLGVFSNREDIVRAARTTVGGSHFFGIQFKYRQECWPQENLDFVTFLAMYFYIETDKHSFLGNDEVAARLLVGIYWSCLAVSERVLVLKNGFYRLFHRYLCATDSQPAGQRETRLNGVRYSAFHHDCFQQPSNIKRKFRS